DLHGLLELRLRLGNLAGIPEDDPLVEDRRRACAAAGGAPRGTAQFRRLLTSLGREIELLFSVIDRREAIVRIGGDRLRFDGLLDGGFSLFVILPSRLY